MELTAQKHGAHWAVLPLYALTTLLMSGAVLLGRDFLDGDPLWHTWTGLQVLAGRIPYYDTFSWTAAGSPWIAHSWLAEAVMAAFYLLLSWDGIRLLSALTIWGVGLASWWAASETAGRPTWVSAVPLAISTAALSAYNNYRPQLFSTLLAVVFVAVLERAERGRGRWLWLLIPLTALWANLHAGFVFAPIIALPYLVRWLLQGRRLGPALLWIAIAAAPLLNPYGPSLLQDHLRLLQSGIVQRYGAEYRSPDFHDPLLFLSMASSAVAVMALSWRTPQERARLALLALLFVSALYSVRNIFLYFPVCAVFLSARLKEVEGPPATRWLAKLRFTVLALLAVLLVALSVAAWTRVPRDSGALPPPEEGRAVLEAVRQPLFNDMTAAGWLIVNGVPVFIDSRMEMYPPQAIRDYVDLVGLSGDPGALLDSYGISSALVRSSSPLARWLEAAEWRPVYRGAHWSVFWRP